jgi:hypothetical protein
VARQRRGTARGKAELDREIGWLTVPELPLPTMLLSDAFAAQPSAAS